MRRWEQVAILAAVLAITVVPWLLPTSRPDTAVAWLGAICLTGAATSLLLWRRAPALTLVLGFGLVLVDAGLGVDPPELGLLVCAALAAVAGYGFDGRAAWSAAAGFAAFLAALYLVTADRSVGLAMLTVPGFVAGTALRLRRRTADELTVRVRELEEEREQFAQLAVRNERARIAAELHDIVGHSLSVMIVQAAAGQRLVDRDPAAADQALEAIAESARQGQTDLRRLVALLGGEPVVGPDLSLVDELVQRAARSGLRVSCRFEGDPEISEMTAAPTAQIAFRVVQEALTNALRYAPGSAVRVLVRGSGAQLTVQVANDGPADAPAAGLVGSGRGLAGLRERVQQLGGSLAAGPVEAGGWAVTARLPR